MFIPFFLHCWYLWKFCNTSFKLGCISDSFSYYVFPTMLYDSWIISQAGKWANRHFVIFFLIERPHLSSKPTFPNLSHATPFRTSLQHRRYLMQLVSERRHSPAHRGSHGSQEVDEDPAGVRLRQGVEEQAGGDEPWDQSEEKPRRHHHHSPESAPSTQSRRQAGPGLYFMSSMVFWIL